MPKTPLGEHQFPSPASAQDPDYYLKNFFLVLAFVQGRDDHLFLEEERQAIHQLLACGEDVKRLYIRLFNRKGPLFLLPSLNYEEIHDIGGAASALQAANLAHLDDDKQDIADVLKLFKAPELKAILRSIAPSLPLKGRRADLEQRLMTLDVQLVFDHIRTMGPRIGLHHRALFERVIRLFFMNSGQDQGTLLAIDLAHVKFANYQCIRSAPIFANRTALEDYECTLVERQCLFEAFEEGDATRALQLMSHLLLAVKQVRETPRHGPRYLDRFSGSWRRARLLSWGVYGLEKAKLYEEAVEFLQALLSSSYSPRHRPKWWDRLVKDLVHLGKKQEAAEATAKALEDPTVRYANRQSMLKRQARLHKQLSLALPSVPKMLRPAETTIHRELLLSAPHRRTEFRALSGEVMLVEALALEHYATEGWMGISSENLLFTNLFGILFWDIIFAPVPDVFQTPFQAAPLDLSTELFYATRKEAIEQRLLEVQRGNALHWLNKGWENEGCQCRGVVWGVYERELLAQLIEVLGGERLSAVLRPLAEDYRLFCRGLPDLLLWNAKGDVRLVEVKGPRDRLSMEQEAWIERLLLAGFDVELCLIREDSATQP